MGYILTTERMRLVKKNDRDRVIARKTFKRGDAITSEDLEKFDVPEDRVERLLDRGTIRNEEEGLPDESEQSAARSAAILGGLAGAATAPAADHSDLEGEEADTSGEPVEEEDGVPVEEVDQYSEMDYSQLQEAAKNASPPIAANQSSDDLRAALRAQNA